MYSVVLLCLVRAAILAVWDPPIMTSLHPPSPVFGRPLSRLTSGFSERLRQWREFSSKFRDSVMTISVAMDKGAMAVGRGSAGAGMTVLALQGCLMDRGSREVNYAAAYVHWCLRGPHMHSKYPLHFRPDIKTAQFQELLLTSHNSS